MVSGQTTDRNKQIAEIAGQFLEFIEVQTGSSPPLPEDVRESDMVDAFAALDTSLDQIADLANVYGSDRMQSIEPLVLPAAALVGEYMRYGSGAEWIEPAMDEDTTLIIATSDGVAVDLTGAVRSSLHSGMSNLKIMVQRLIHPEAP